MARPSDGAGSSGLPAKAAWFTPGRLLVLFCTMNMFIYIDRGVIASNGVNGSPQSGIQGDFGLSLFQDGLLPAAFMVGLLASSPIFAEASKHFNAFRLIGLGLGVWTLAAAGCGLSVGFASLLLCRMAVGVGEASFVALASPFIDDNAPPESKTRWLAIFYLCIPTGYAVGYIYGGLVAAALGWRAAFLLEAAAMLPFVAFCLRAPAIDIRGTHAKQHVQQGGDGDSDGGSRAVAGSPAAALHGRRGRGEEGRLLEGHGPLSSAEDQDGQAHVPAGKSRWAQRLRAGAAAVWADLRQLAAHPVYVLAVGGMTFYTAVLGTFAFYGPKAGREVFDIAPETADLAFGAITVVTGVFGTLAGGVLLDRVGSSLRNALLVCAGGTAVGCALIVLGFVAARSFAAFAVALAAGEFAMFMTQAPSNAICMWAVPPGLRPFAMSMSVVAMHVLGDVPGPPLLGALQSKLRNWRLSMSLCSALLLGGAGMYAAAMLCARTAVDYRAVVPVEEEEEGGRGEGGGGALLGGPGGDHDSLEEGAAEAFGGETGVGADVGGWEQQGAAASGRASPERPLLPGGGAPA